MPVTMDVLNDGRILLVHFTDPWKTAEMYTLFKADERHRDAFMQSHPDQPVHLVVDFSSTNRIDQGVLQARNSPSLTHPTSGSTVVVGASPLMQTLARTGFELIRYKAYRFVPTVEAALTYLRFVIERT